MDGRRTLPIAILLMVGLSLACQVGEAPPEGPRPGGAESAPAVSTRAAAEDLLQQAQHALEVAQPDTALMLAKRVIDDYPATESAMPALWVAAQAAYAQRDWATAAKYAEDYASRLDESEPSARHAYQLMFAARDSAAPAQTSPVLLGVILPRSGSLKRYGDWVLEGIQLAVKEQQERVNQQVQLVVLDDSAKPYLDGDLTRQLEQQGVVGIIGPLMDQGLQMAAQSRLDPDLVIVSPTATKTPAYWNNIYALNGGDVRGAQDLASYAYDLGFNRAAVIYPSGEDTYARKAQAFQDAFRSRGGDIVATVPYDSGTTTFADPLRTALRAASPVVDTAQPFIVHVDSGPQMRRPAMDTMPPAFRSFYTPSRSTHGDTAEYNMGPWALYVPAPPGDVRQIAPQVEYYGLDSAGVQVFGDASWTSPDILRQVDRRALDGVLAVATLNPGDAERGVSSDFVARYEAQYRKTLSNPLPALGYDAAHLLLASTPTWDPTPARVARRMSLMVGIRGATGVFSIYGPDVVRSPFLVLIQDGRLVPAPRPDEYQMPIAVPPKRQGADASGRSGHRRRP
jgi:ABC-type branched-subunit amino acid transport system substrate-binding protein